MNSPAAMYFVQVFMSVLAHECLYFMHNFSFSNELGFGYFQAERLLQKGRNTL